MKHERLLRHIEYPQKEHGLQLRNAAPLLLLSSKRFAPDDHDHYY